MYRKLEQGADPNFVFGRAYQSWEGYTPLMVACHRCVSMACPHAGSAACHHHQAQLRRGRLDCVKAMLRQGADPNFINAGHDLTLFWGIDGGVEIIKLLQSYGADLDARTPKDWTPLSFCRAKVKYGATEEKGIYPEVLTPPSASPHSSTSLTAACAYGGAHKQHALLKDGSL